METARRRKFPLVFNGLDNRRRRELACTTEVFEYLQSYFPSALILWLGPALNLLKITNEIVI